MTRVASLDPLIDGEQLGDFVRVDQIAVAGTGCPQSQMGTLADFDTERNILEVSMRKFTLTAVKGAKLDRKTCAIAIPVQLPRGKRLVISQLDFGGKVSLVPGAVATAKVESFVASSSRPTQSKEVRAAADPIQGRILLRTNDNLKSPCGANAVIRVNTDTTLQNNSMKPSTVEMDRIALYLKVESCK